MCDLLFVEQEFHHFEGRLGYAEAGAEDDDLSSALKYPVIKKLFILSRNLKNCFIFALWNSKDAADEINENWDILAEKRLFLFGMLGTSTISNLPKE